MIICLINLEIFWHKVICVVSCHLYTIGIILTSLCIVKEVHLIGNGKLILQVWVNEKEYLHIGLGEAWVLIRVILQQEKKLLKNLIQAELQKLL